MPTISFFLFLRLNRSVNDLKPRIYYIALHYITLISCVNLIAHNIAWASILSLKAVVLKSNALPV